MATEGHGTAPDGSECLACMEDLTDETYVEYATEEGQQWQPSLYCSNCVEHLRKNQFKQYAKQLSATTCKAEQRRLLTRGPPIYVHDKTALPVPDGSGVKLLWYACDQQVRSAKLEGALEGDERTTWWEEQKKFIIEDEPDEEGATEQGQQNA